MVAHAATAQNITLQGENTAQRRTPLVMLARMLVTWKQKCRKSNKAKDSNKKAKSQFCHRPGGREKADEVGVLDGDPTFDEITIHA